MELDAVEISAEIGEALSLDCVGYFSAELEDRRGSFSDLHHHDLSSQFDLSNDEVVNAPLQVFDRMHETKLLAPYIDHEYLLQNQVPLSHCAIQSDQTSDAQHDMDNKGDMLYSVVVLWSNLPQGLINYLFSLITLQAKEDSYFLQLCSKIEVLFSHSIGLTIFPESYVMKFYASSNDFPSQVDLLLSLIGLDNFSKEGIGDLSGYHIAPTDTVFTFAEIPTSKFSLRIEFLIEVGNEIGGMALLSLLTYLGEIIADNLWVGILYLISGMVLKLELVKTKLLADRHAILISDCEPLQALHSGGIIAIYWEGIGLSNCLNYVGVCKGVDLVFYLPKLMELAITMLGCASLRAIHSVAFVGFYVESLVQRIMDCKPKVNIYCNVVKRGTKMVYLKEIVEDKCAYSGYLCVRSSWPGVFRTLYGENERYETTYFNAFSGYYLSGDGCNMDKGKVDTSHTQMKITLSGLLLTILGLYKKVHKIALVDSCRLHNLLNASLFTKSEPHLVEFENLNVVEILSTLLPVDGITNDSKAHLTFSVGLQPYNDIYHCFLTISLVSLEDLFVILINICRLKENLLTFGALSVLKHFLPKLEEIILDLEQSYEGSIKELMYVVFVVAHENFTVSELAPTVQDGPIKAGNGFYKKATKMRTEAYKDEMSTSPDNTSTKSGLSDTSTVYCTFVWDPGIDKL